MFHNMEHCSASAQESQPSIDALTVARYNAMWNNHQCEGENIVAKRSEGQRGLVAAVVLAAGRSSRMGRAKQLEVVDGAPMVVRAVELALQSEATAVLVVTGAYAAEVQAALVSLQELHGARLQLVHNDEWATGQASSVRAAVLVLPANIDAALFLPVDQPFVPAILLQQLIAAWQQGAPLAAPTLDGQPRGAPAIFDRSLWGELLALEGDVGARPLLQRHRAELVTVPAQAAWLRDIDTPADLATTDPGFAATSPSRES